jgi:hypothetical protein
MPVQLLRRLAPRRCALVHAAKAPRAIPGPGSYWTGSARRSARSVSYEPSAPAGPLPYRQPGRLRGCVPPRHPNARRRLDRGRSGLYFVHCAACCSPGWLGFGRPRWAGAEQLGEFHPGPVQAAGNLDKKDIAFGTARARIAPEPDRFNAAAPFWLCGSASPSAAAAAYQEWPAMDLTWRLPLILASRGLASRTMDTRV